MVNSGLIRFDLYSGPFTRNDQFTIAPFADSFRYLSNIPLSDAMAAFNALNGAGDSERRQETEELVARHYDAIQGYERGEVDLIFNNWLKKMDQEIDVQRRAMKNLTLGYVTQDVSPSFVLYLHGFLILCMNFSPVQASEMTPNTLQFPSSSTYPNSSCPNRRPETILHLIPP